MDLYEAMYTTRSMRRVKPDPIPDDVLGRIFDAAVRGPSGGNSHTFRFVTVTDNATKAKLKPLYHDSYWELQETAYAGLREKLENADPHDPSMAQSRRISKSAEDFIENFEQHPMLIFVFGKDRGESTTFPVLWNLCLAARAEGLGTFITTLLKYRKREVEELIGMPEGFWHMHAMIPIGYPTGRWGMAERNPIEEFVYSETWGNPVSWESTPNWTEPDGYGRS
ncbi:MAG: nitroreductase family protein [Acidimicrobiales bacterium]